MSIGRKLKELRGNKTLNEVAEVLGITPSALSNYENDFRIPRDEIKKKIAFFYNVSVEEIFFNEKLH